MKKVLVIGGSGHVSGAVVLAALATDYKVFTITRGTRPAVGCVTGLHADRHDAEAMPKVAQSIAHERFDAVIDCIGFNADDIQQDLELFGPLTDHLLFVSTDWVYEPTLRRYPQPVENSPYLSSDHDGFESYGWGKLMAENYLREYAPAHLKYTIFRPCHIYGMPSELGCFPGHCRDAELIARLLRSETLELVDNGRLLQQPIDCNDLAQTMISAIGNTKAYNKAFNMAGPDIVESRYYYQIIADVLGVELKTANIDYDEYLQKHPHHRPFLFHRIYLQDDLQNADLHVPDIPLRSGLEKHTRALREKLGI